MKSREISERKIHETDVHDLSLSVIHALAMVDVKVLSYMQLRRLYAALTHARDSVETETSVRTAMSNAGDTTTVQAPALREPAE